VLFLLGFADNGADVVASRERFDKNAVSDMARDAGDL
jgi:hypothetical protein